MQSHPKCPSSPFFSFFTRIRYVTSATSQWHWFLLNAAISLLCIRVKLKVKGKIMTRKWTRSLIVLIVRGACINWIFTFLLLLFEMSSRDAHLLRCTQTSFHMIMLGASYMLLDDTQCVLSSPLLSFAWEENCSSLFICLLCLQLSLCLSFLFSLSLKLSLSGRTHHDQHTLKSTIFNFSKSLIFYFTILYSMFFHHLSLSPLNRCRECRFNRYHLCLFARKILHWPWIRWFFFFTYRLTHTHAHPRAYLSTFIWRVSRCFSSSLSCFIIGAVGAAHRTPDHMCPIVTFYCY